ncbi:ABC transporter permease [Candidatus Bathyarchaeota archaeon]|nr:ABC transporter permease [Candidatus Bathyarchaeota archaeon]
MGLKSSFMIAARSLLRRKTKNLSAILAVTLGVTLLVGIQITTDTLENSFLTSLLQGEGEVDFSVSNSTTTGYLTAADAETISDIVPSAVGIMPELTMEVPVMVGSQYDDSVELAGISTDYPDAFGSFYDWQTGEEMHLDALLVSNTTIILSSKQAEKLGLTEETMLPLNLTTEFTNTTGTVVEPPTLSLADWTVEESYTTVLYDLNSSSSYFSLNLEQSPLPGVVPSLVTLFKMNISMLDLSDFDYLNVTATGTSNIQVLLQFSLDDGSNFNVTNLEDASLPVDIDTLNAAFDLSPYADRTLRGDAFLVVMSADGMPASIEISEIAFETSKPVISYSSEVERTTLQVVGIFDSKHPGIGSQYSGAILRIEHVQQWLALQDREKEFDRVSSYLVALQTDHFTSEISEDYLQEQVDIVEAAIPETVDPDTGDSEKIYTVSSARLTFFSVAEIIMTLLSTMLTALGLLITITGVLLITNVQLMNVEDREFQTGVMRAVGENRRGITMSMLIENVFQGILGGIFGLIGGLGFGQTVANYLANIFGTGEFSVQPVVSQQVVILSVLIGVVLGVVTGVLPALRASRVNIVEALRGIKVTFEEKSGRNLVLLGILATAGGVFVLLINGVIDTSYEGIWLTEGWNTLDEWRNILIGSGLLFTGLGMVLSRFISRVKALNITAFAVWGAPVFLFVVAMGEWIPDISGLAPDILIIGVAEIVIGSVLLVSVNLPPLMRALRTFLVKIRGVKGVGQIAPALISSHKTRSTLTFAIFAVILTLNVTVATLVPTNLSSIIETEEDSRGVDLIVSLNMPEANITGLSYTEELYKIDSHITDVIGFKTYKSLTDYQRYLALADPYSSDFDYETDLLPLGYGVITTEQIRGNATDSFDSNWRYDFYLSSFPDAIGQPPVADVTDEQLNSMSKQAWDLFFASAYTMPAYNVSLSDLMSEDRDLNDIDFTSFSGYSGYELEDVEVLRDENGSVIENPIVFTDSFLLPLGMQVWIPMNTSESGFPAYQAFTIAGRLDSQRAGGFPLSSFNLLSGDDFNFMDALGNIYMNEYWANQTSYLAEADGETSTARAPEQYNKFLIKTTYAMDDPQIQSIAQAIEEFTNTDDEGYRSLAEDNFYVASTTILYSKIEQSMEMIQRVVSFLQIYVTFGLVIGAVGMTVISVRNVSERKREIGMMRAIGFPRTQVMLSVLLELVVLGIIGLAIGVVNGVLISVGFANMQGATLVIPWNDIFVYLGFITAIAIAAGAVPGWFASRIPPAEALRYVG